MQPFQWDNSHGQIGIAGLAVKDGGSVVRRAAGDAAIIKAELALALHGHGPVNAAIELPASVVAHGKRLRPLVDKLPCHVAVIQHTPQLRVLNRDVDGRFILTPSVSRPKEPSHCSNGVFFSCGFRSADGKSLLLPAFCLPDALILSESLKNVKCSF